MEELLLCVVITLIVITFSARSPSYAKDVDSKILN